MALNVPAASASAALAEAKASNLVPLRSNPSKVSFSLSTKPNLRFLSKSSVKSSTQRTTIRIQDLRRRRYWRPLMELVYLSFNILVVLMEYFSTPALYLQIQASRKKKLPHLALRLFRFSQLGSPPG